MMLFGAKLYQLSLDHDLKDIPGLNMERAFISFDIIFIKIVLLYI